MTFAAARRWLVRAGAHPVTFLLAVNIACALLGVVQLVYTLAVLGPADFAVIGVLAAFAGVIAGLLDVKLADLATRLLFATPASEPAARAAVLSASLALHAAVGIAATGLIIAVAYALAPGLLQAPPQTWWIAASAARVGSGYPMTSMTSSLRLLGDFRASGWLRLATQLVMTAVMIAALKASPDLGGYFAAVAVSTLLSLGFAIVVLSALGRRALGHSLLALAPRATFGQFLSSMAFIAGGSLGGLAKLLGRSCDVLVVAAFTNDTVTGTYRVARQGYDTMAGLTDAVHQFYTPTVVESLSRGRWAEFRRHRNRLMAIGVAAALGTVLASWIVLRPLAVHYFPQYSPVLPAFEIFAGLLVVTLGVHGWLWPSLVAAGRIRRFGVLGIVGAAVQLATLVLLARAGRLDVATAAGAAWIMAAINYGPLLIEDRTRRHPTAT